MKKSKKVIDIKYINIPNVCFSLTKKGDEREVKFAKQRRKRGFDDSETWALDCTIAEFVIPRLQRYLKVADEVIVIDDKYRRDIEKILRTMHLIMRDDGAQLWSAKEIKQVEKGLKLFSKRFLSFGW